MNTRRLPKLLTDSLRPAGGSRRAMAQVIRPSSLDELLKVVQLLNEQGSSCTIVGGRRSFGEQFIPNQSDYALDLRGLPSEFRELESSDDTTWIRASGWANFGELMQFCAPALPIDPPTSPKITLAGALVAGSHSSASYISHNIRAFTLLLSSGKTLRCSADDANPRSRELFSLIPGSFGALGIVTELEIKVRRYPKESFVVAEIIDVGNRKDLPRLLTLLDELAEDSRYRLGRALYFIGAGERIGVIADTIDTDERPKKSLPLANGKVVPNILLQALSSRFPRASQFFQSLSLKKGTLYAAELEDFLFFQSSYDDAEQWLSSRRLGATALRAIGVNPELPVAHMTWVVPRATAQDYFSSFLQALKLNPTVLSYMELHDVIRLPEVKNPLHPAYGLAGGAYLHTPSAATRSAESAAQLSAFFQEWSERAHHEFGAIPHLLKQLHVQQSLLETTYSKRWKPLLELKKELDPKGLWDSKLLRQMNFSGEKKTPILIESTEDAGANLC